MEPTTGGRTPTRRRTIPLALLLVGILVVNLDTGAAEAGVFEYAEIHMGPELFEAELHRESREGDAAARFRQIVDEDHGDADGTVTQEEVDAYRAAIEKEFNDRLSNPFAAALVDKFRVNDRPPLSVRVTDIQVTENVLGPTDDNSTLYRDIYAEMRYPSTSRDTANVTFASDFRQAFPGLEWGTARFTGDPPWAIDPETVDPQEVRERFWTGDGFNVTYSETPEFASGFEPLAFQLYNTSAVEEEEEDEEDSPGLALPLSLVALGLVAVGLRRRRF